MPDPYQIMDKKPKVVFMPEGKAVFVLPGTSLLETAGRDGNQVFITQRDVRELQLAKAAISAGVKLLKDELGVSDSDIQEILLAGAFGNFIRRSNAKRIGLIPNLTSEKIKFIGNAACSGAKLALLSRDLEKEAETISSSVEHVELSRHKDFQNEFADAMLFPEM